MLEEGADPTLSGCWTDDQYADAFQTARMGTGKGAKRCVALMDAVKPFWATAKYAGVHYNKKSRQKFTNAPNEGMLDAWQLFNVFKQKTAVGGEVLILYITRLKN